MKKTILMICIWLITFCVATTAQKEKKVSEYEAGAEYSCPSQEDIRTVIATSQASMSLHLVLSDPNRKNWRRSLRNAVNDAVKTGDKSLVPYLKMRMQCYFGPTHSLDIALVALGETQYVDKAIKQVETGNHVVRYWAVWKLVRFKTKESYQKLYELLDDDKIPDQHKAKDASVGSLSEVTKTHLFREVDNPPSDRYSTEAWKAWFRKNHVVK